MTKSEWEAKKKAEGLKWFAETFLPSLDSRMNNPKYPNQCILSDAQADICYKYMNSKQYCDDWGHWFTTYEFDTEEFNYLLKRAGRWNIIRKYPIVKNLDWDEEAQIIIDRGLFDEAIRKMDKDIYDKVEAEAKECGNYTDVDFLGDCLFWYYKKYNKLFVI